MRETLSLIRWYHWRHSFWNGHYKWLVKQWGWKCVFIDTWTEIKWKIKEGQDANR